MLLGNLLQKRLRMAIGRKKKEDPFEKGKKRARGEKRNSSSRWEDKKKDQKTIGRHKRKKKIMPTTTR